MKYSKVAGLNNVSPRYFLYERLIECAWVVAAFEDIYDFFFCGEVEVAGDGVLEGCGC